MKSHQISAFFLLMTVLLSSTLAQNRFGPGVCCFRYFPGRLRMELITRYEETREDCSKPGIIFYTKEGKEVCVDPSACWVQQVMKKLDQHIHAKEPEQCCFTYFPGRLTMELIARYEETNAECPKPGIIFYTKHDYEVCVDPSSPWVQQVMKELDQRLRQ